MIANLVSTGVISDAGMAYFDVRPAVRTPTLELRVCDSCPRVDTIVLVSALFRAFVEREIEALRAGQPTVKVPSALGRAALWRAARSGLEGDLVDLTCPGKQPAAHVVSDLIRLVRPQPEAAGDWEIVGDLASQALIDGSSAARQHRVMEERNSLLDVVDHLIAETAGVELAHGAENRRYNLL